MKFYYSKQKARHNFAQLLVDSDFESQAVLFVGAQSYTIDLAGRSWQFNPATEYWTFCGDLVETLLVLCSPKIIRIRKSRRQIRSKTT